MSGNVFHIQRFSLHDGPGIRTTCFLMGCSLRCLWCHNPEGLCSEKQLQYHEKDCIRCRICEKICPEGVHRMDAARHEVYFEKCIRCGKCVESCPSGSLSFTGKAYTPEALAEICARDKTAYRENGGVTFSGGEPLLQPDFVADTAWKCKELGIPSVAVDTAGNVEWEAFETVLPWADIFLFDLKAGTEKTHILGTGVSNRRILENLQRLDKTGKTIYIRVPVIGGINDTVEEMAGIGDILRGLNSVAEVRLLPYHTFGREKYKTLGLAEPALFSAPEEERIRELQSVCLGRKNLNV